MTYYARTKEELQDYLQRCLKCDKIEIVSPQHGGWILQHEIQIEIERSGENAKRFARYVLREGTESLYCISSN